MKREGKVRELKINGSGIKWKGFLRGLGRGVRGILK